MLALFPCQVVMEVLVFFWYGNLWPKYNIAFKIKVLYISHYIHITFDIENFD